MVYATELDCHCPTRTLTRRTFRNGSQHWTWQCILCGSHSKSIKAEEAQALIRAGEKWEEFDEARAELFRESLRRKNQSERIEEREMRQADYARYLQSPEWKAKRTKVLRRAEGVCEGCLSRPAVEVHHTTYANCGNELLFELVAVCKSCREQAHGAVE